jgi:hypothetical protein
MFSRSRQRSKKGASTVALVLVIAFGAILPLGLLGFELIRFFVIQEELRNITDASALAGTAAMASAPSAPASFGSPPHMWTYEDREACAMSVSAFTFTQNTILENQFGLAAGSPVLSYTDAEGYTVPVTATANAPFNVNVNIDPNPPMPASPPLNSVTLNICLYTTVGGVQTQVPMGIPASTITVYAYYTDKPALLGTQSGWNMFVNNMNGNFTVAAVSNGGLPSIDLLLAYDTSASMDDATAVAFVNRYWTGGASTATGAGNTPGYAGQAMCWSVVTFNGTGTSNTIYATLNPPFTGTGVNAFYPQNLDYASWPHETDPEGYAVGNVYPLLFTETQGYPSDTSIQANTNGLRGNTTVASLGGTTMPEQGWPPGNAVPGTLSSNNGPSGTLQPTNPYLGASFSGSAWTSAGSAPPIFTDMVVLPSTYNSSTGVYTPVTVVTGPTGGTSTLSTTASVTNGGTSFNFTTVAELVEASRGNLDSTAALTSATMGQYTNKLFGSGVVPGSFNAYWLWVLQAALPIAPAEAAAYDFFQTMHLSADSHFGLETFASVAASLTAPVAGYTTGTGATETTIAMPNISSFWPPSGTFNTAFPFPCVADSQSTDNYNAITTQFLPPSLTSYTAPPSATTLPLEPTTATDIADALNQAITIMTSTTDTRATAKKAIILFTDGVPTGDESAGITFHEIEGYNDAIAAAKTASNTPMPIYTIGLSTNLDIIPYENNLLGDGMAIPSPGGPGNYPQGIAYDSDPNVARYYPVTNPQDLEQAFQTIARSLCVLVQIQ